MPERSEGSGFIVDASGYILTNEHLVAHPAKIRIRLADKRELKARVVGTDQSTDLALLKVEADHLPTAWATGCAPSGIPSSSTTR